MSMACPHPHLAQRTSSWIWTCALTGSRGRGGGGGGAAVADRRGASSAAAPRGARDVDPTSVFSGRLCKATHKRQRGSACSAMGPR